jgi:hypothetical protein
MFLVLTASSDAYITDKIINNTFRAKDANTGMAGTLDLFKLYDESTISGETDPIELSRVLIKFKYDRIKALTSSILDFSSNSFKCELVMKDISAGQMSPTDFKLILFPLSKSFDEGFGRDISKFGDLDRVNWLTSSYSNSTDSVWFVTGANKQGYLGSTDIDIISSGTLSGSSSGVNVNLFRTQSFVKGDEDLKMDITTIVSASLAGLMTNHGFRLSFSGSEETDTKTRFVKRFASRHVTKKTLRPQIHVTFDDSLQDHHQSFFFDVSGSLFLNNYHRGKETNLVSGSAASSIGGANSLLVSIRSGSWVQHITASQHTGSSTSTGLPGVYSASFAISSSDSTVVDFGTTLSQMISRTGSITFDEYWSDFSGLVGYHTGSLTVKSPTRTGFNYVSRRPDLYATNARSLYRISDIVRFRVYGVDHEEEFKKAVKKPLKRPSIIFDEVYYRVLDVDSGEEVMPYKRDNNGTRLSSDSQGHFFNFRMDNLFIGRNYTFEYLVIDRGQEFKIKDSRVRFKLEQ